MTSAAQLDNWKQRRRVVWTVLIYSGLTLWFLVYKDSDRKVAETATDGLVMLIGATVVAYLGAPIADDFLKRKQLTANRRPSALKPDNPDA